jgi:hypothetical protein
MGTNVRSEASRLLNPRIGKDSPVILAEFRSAVDKAKGAMCGHWAKMFKTQAEVVMNVPLNDTMCDQLRGIMMSAAEVAEKLHAQRSYLAIDGRLSLPDKFNSSSLFMTAHSSLFPVMDEDEHCMDGKDILVVMHPAVTAMGSSDGSDTSTVRVLKKAVVWMGKGPED